MRNKWRIELVTTFTIHFSMMTNCTCGKLQDIELKRLAFLLSLNYGEKGFFIEFNAANLL